MVSRKTKVVRVRKSTYNVIKSRARKRKCNIADVIEGYLGKKSRKC